MSRGWGLSFIGNRPSSHSIDVTDGAINVMLLPYDGPPRTSLEEGTEFIHFGFQVQDLSAVYRRLIELSADVVRDDIKERNPHDTASVPVGSFKVLDPDGNVIDVSDRPEEWRAVVPR